MPTRQHEAVIPDIRIDSQAVNNHPRVPQVTVEEDQDEDEIVDTGLDPAKMSKSDLRKVESDVLSGLLAASADLSSTTAKIEVERRGRVFFAFKIRPLNEREVEKLRDACTSYKRDPRTGLRLPENVDTSRFRSMQIYEATVDEDRIQLWDNPTVKQRLNVYGPGYEVIDEVLKPGEKDRIIMVLNEISGYSSEVEEGRKSTD